MPALLILIFVFFIHQQGKRQEAKARCARGRGGRRDGPDARDRIGTPGSFRRRRSDESLDLESIRVTPRRSICRSSLGPTSRGCCCARRTLAGARRHGARRPPRGRAARASRSRTVRCRRDGGVRMTPVSADGQLCFPLTAGGQTLGVLGIPERAGPFTAGRQRVFAAAATLLAIAIRNAQLFEELRENSLRDGLTGCVNRHARDRGDRHRTAARAPIADAGLGHHVRHRSLQGDQRSVRPLVRRRGAGRPSARGCAPCCAAAT